MSKCGKLATKCLWKYGYLLQCSELVGGGGGGGCDVVD